MRNWTGRRVPALATLGAWAVLGMLVSPALADPVYVSVSGSDASPGTPALPVRTIAQAIALASGSGRPVDIGEGTYAETVNLASGVSLFGGFVPADGWTRDPVLHPTVIEGGSSAVLGDGDVGLTLDGLVIHSANADTAGSSIGVFLASCQNVGIMNCRIEAGNGGVGAPGAAGTAGAAGANGQIGKPGCENSTGFLCSTCARPLGGPGGVNPWGNGGGKGGDAGQGTSFGSPGATGFGAGAGTGGAGTPPSYTGDYTPYLGGPGAAGTAGSGGAGGGALGDVSAAGYSPASGQPGLPGEHGSGGGGGGGGGGGSVDCDSYGSSGGGGGGGGERGGAGGGGGGAGGSFCVVLHACENITVQNCTLTTGAGGAGGVGGAGGLGGPGGTGGPGGPYGGSMEQDDGSDGAPGGNGGPGGDGGAGGGGGGGPTIAIFNAGAGALAVKDNVYTLGIPGPGGGGPSPGATGASEEIHGPSGLAAVDDPAGLPVTAELSCAPNPFRASTRLDYVLPAEGRVSLTVHDLRGACVATLAHGSLAAGRYSAAWDGSMAGGGKAPAGLYFVRLAVGGAGGDEIRRVKVVMTK